MTEDFATAEAPAQDRPTVLVVEDEESMVGLYRDWLADDHEVLIAGDGEEGLEALSEDVDVVVLDRRMPGMDGDAFLHAMKDEGYRAGVVMVTAVDPEPDIVDLPFDDYMTKPVSEADVLSLVDRMLHLQKAGAAVRRYHSLERRRDVLRGVKDRTGDVDMEKFDLLTRRLEAAARDAGAGLAMLDADFYETSRTWVAD